MIKIFEKSGSVKALLAGGVLRTFGKSGFIVTTVSSYLIPVVVVLENVLYDDSTAVFYDDLTNVTYDS